MRRKDRLLAEQLWQTGLGPRRIHDLISQARGGIARVASRRVAPRGLLEWGRAYLPQHFAKPPSGMHQWLAEQLDGMQAARGQKLNVIGPRGGAKSTIGTLAYVLRAAVEAWEPYIWIISDTKHQACAHLDNVKLELAENERLRADYPAAVQKGLLWRSNAIQVPNGVFIEAFGTGQRIRGRRRGADRPTLIVCDDLQNDQHMQSATQREHSECWFQGTLLKAGTPRTNIINLATALHRDALALKLDRTPGWTSRTFRAISRWPNNMSLWHDWESKYCDMENPRRREQALEFYRQNRVAMDAGAELLWPAEEDLYCLMSMRVESGRTAFEREKQGAPIAAHACEWPEQYFDEQIWFDQWPPGLALKTIALDPSKGQSARHGDFSAFVLLGVDPSGLVFVEADLARRATPQMVADGVELCRLFRPHAFGVEVNQFQDLLASEFQHEFARQQVLGITPWTLENRVNKQVRIRRLGPYLSGRRMRFKSGSPGTRLLVEQLRDFPAGDHDDGPDALEMALRLAGELLSGPGDGLGSRLPLDLSNP